MCGSARKCAEVRASVRQSARKCAEVCASARRACVRVRKCAEVRGSVRKCAPCLCAGTLLCARIAFLPILLRLCFFSKETHIFRKSDARSVFCICILRPCPQITSLASKPPISQHTPVRSTETYQNPRNLRDSLFSHKLGAESHSGKSGSSIASSCSSDSTSKPLLS